MTRAEFYRLFGGGKAVIGVVHLLPLPGSPRYTGEFSSIVDRALRDARAYVEAGFNGLIVENFGDAPFYPDQVGPETVAAMAVVTSAVRAAVEVPVGVNVLRNDARAALAVATAAGGRFIRVNVHTGAMLTDQGILQGKAAETLRLRKMLSADVRIFADVLVKHGAPLVETPLERAALDTVERGLADAVILTGEATGKETDPAAVLSVKEAISDVPVLVGSGVTPSNARLFAHADGFIIGSWAKVGGKATEPVDPERARAVVKAIEKITEQV